MKDFDTSTLHAYSGYFNDTEKLLQSSSGGGASALSAEILTGGGAIFGACYSEDFKRAEFACIEREEDLFRLKGSKYIETDKRIFQGNKYVSLWPIVAEKLEAGKKVLFIGLGCDVAALKAFLSNKKVDTSNLYTVDLICMGPTFQEVHRQYIENLERKYQSRIINFTVRHKAKGWTPPYILAEFENGKKFSTLFYGTDYGIAFGSYARRVCYGCKFRGKNHQADITVGDFWGLKPGMKGYNPNGVSIFLVRTEQGEELIRKIDREKFTIEPADVDFAVEHNPMYYKRREIPEDYDKFCEDLKSVGLHRAIINHLGIKRYYKQKLKEFVKGILPAPVKAIIKRML